MGNAVVPSTELNILSYLRDRAGWLNDSDSDGGGGPGGVAMSDGRTGVLSAGRFDRFSVIRPLGRSRLNR